MFIIETIFLTNIVNKAYTGFYTFYPLSQKNEISPVAILKNVFSSFMVARDTGECSIPDKMKYGKKTSLWILKV